MKNIALLLATTALIGFAAPSARAQISAAPDATTQAPNTATSATVTTPAIAQPPGAAATPGAPADATATAAAAAAPAGCTADKPNPAMDILKKPDLPASLQKLYNLRLPQFTAADTNCDGFLDKDEMTKLVDQKFIAADTDKNGSISEAEAQAIVSNFEEAADNTPGIIPEKRANTLKHRIALMDTNGDDVISKPEFEAYYLARYQLLDKNHDGKLDITEYQTDDEDNRRERN